MLLVGALSVVEGLPHFCLCADQSRRHNPLSLNHCWQHCWQPSNHIAERHCRNRNLTTLGACPGQFAVPFPTSPTQELPTSSCPQIYHTSHLGTSSPFSTITLRFTSLHHLLPLHYPPPALYLPLSFTKRRPFPASLVLDVPSNQKPRRFKQPQLPRLSESSQSPTLHGSSLLR